tara:strand:+ start:16448 stop:17665 length:1218 start_codon:yes stop_codon:yes gene_type:complete
MNPDLHRLHDYPFQRMAALKQGVAGNAEFQHVALSIGEPQHEPPGFVLDLLSDRSALARDLATYPATRGEAFLREAISDWLNRRFGVRTVPDRHVLPVSGTREALFSIAQAVLRPDPSALVIQPNPFYQIYEGAALLGGAQPYYVNCSAESGYQPDFSALPESVWARCQLLYLCSPGNPTGRNLDADTLGWLLEQAHRHDFVIAADECYSEIYFDEPPVGLLQVALQAGHSDFSRCVVFHSLSKRSNLPGLRSGFVAGDAQLLEQYFSYRTYQGCAMPVHHQRASAAAWADEAHVQANRQAYQDKFRAVTPILERVANVIPPQGGFYHWLKVDDDDQAFARELFRACNITVLPGSFLGRDPAAVNADQSDCKGNPGAGHIRVAWVAPAEQCVAAAERLTQWWQSR